MMSWLLHELALESVLIVLFLVRWAMEWWAGGRVAKRNAKLIADNNEARDHIKTELAEIKAAVKGEDAE